MIEFKNVYKNFEDTKVLENFSLKIPDNGIICLFGKSGVGKTTILRLLAGIIEPSDGQIVGLEGKEVSYVFQEDRLLPTFTCLQNASLCDEKNIAMEYIEKFGLSGKENSKITELSGGMRRRVAIIRALSANFDLLILDEPFDGIDENSLTPIYDEILQVSNTTPVILVTHNLQQAQALNATIVKV